MDKIEIAVSLLTIIAIVSGPIIALQVQRKLDREREALNRKLWVFKTLMSFRATALAPSFVQALNLIDVEFNGNDEKEKAVRNAWKVLLHITANSAYCRLSKLDLPYLASTAASLRCRTGTRKFPSPQADSRKRESMRSVSPFTRSSMFSTNH
jgi:hypothetical protein